MNKCVWRERVELALDHKEADRVPIDLMGNGTMLIDSVYLELCEYFGISPVKPFRRGTTANYYDERILDLLDIDFRRIFINRRAHDDFQDSEGIYKDIWGISYKKTGPLYNSIDHPLENIDSIKEIDEYPWPLPKDIFSAEGLRKKAQNMYEHTGYAIVARNPVTAGFLDRACAMAGMEGFFVMMYTQPELAHHIIDKLLCIYKDIYYMFLDEVGPYVQMVETGDDLGTMENLLISPELYREFIRPADMQMNSLIHEMAPKAKLFKHCDGAIFELIPDLLETGVDVINPVQTSARGMDAKRLKKTYGNKICFHGGLEYTGSSEKAILEQIKILIDELSTEGGYIFASCNHIIEADAGNIARVFDFAREYGNFNRNK